MSLVHLDKSVLTFHFKEVLEGGQGNHPLAWVGLGVLILGPKILPNLAKASQPVAKNLVKRNLARSQSSGISLTQWIEEARHRELVMQQAVTYPKRGGSLKQLHRAEVVALSMATDTAPGASSVATGKSENGKSEARKTGTPGKNISEQSVFEKYPMDYRKVS